MKYHVAAALALSILLAVLPEAAAQQANSFEQLQLLVKAGDTVSVTESSGQISQGRIAELSQSSLRLLVDGVVRELPEVTVLEIKQRRGDALGNGAKNGALVGAGIGVACGILLGALGDPGLGAVVAGFYTGLGAGVGVGIDALIIRPQVIYHSRGGTSSSINIRPGLERTQRHPCIALILIVPIKPTFVLLLWLALGASSLAAQPRNEFGPWIAVSAGTPTLIGKTERVSLSLIAMRYSRIVLRRSAFDVRYTADVIPIMRLTYLIDSDEFETVDGRGAAPLGFEISFRPGKRVEPAGALSGGFIVFDKDVPQRGRRLNFSADLGLGLRIHIGRSVGVRAGYNYHHISNAYRAPANPGFDSNLVTIGVNVTQ